MSKYEEELKKYSTEAESTVRNLFESSDTLTTRDAASCLRSIADKWENIDTGTKKGKPGKAE